MTDLRRQHDAVLDALAITDRENVIEVLETALSMVTEHMLNARRAPSVAIPRHDAERAMEDWQRDNLTDSPQPDRTGQKFDTATQTWVPDPDAATWGAK